MEIKKSSVTLKVYGEKFELTKPTVRQAQAYASKLKDIDDNGAIEEMINLLSDCGMDKEFALDMEVGHLAEVMTALMPAPKK